MSGYPRDLAAIEPWSASLARSLARRQRAKRKTAAQAPAHSVLLNNRVELSRAALRDLSDSEPWEMSLGRSRARRRARELRFVPAGTRAKRLSLGALVALGVGPTTSLGEAAASPTATGPAPEPPTTSEHSIVLSSDSEGRQVRLLQLALGIAPDGIYGPATQAAVEKFQAAHGLAVDGVAGPATTAALGERSVRASAASVSHSSNVIVRLQEALHISVDGVFGSETEQAIRDFQQSHNLTVDGIVGPATWSALGVPGQPTLHPPHSHHSHSAAPAHAARAARSGSSNAVVRLQEALHISADGVFGSETEQAIRDFQQSHNLTVDGIVGPATWSALGVPGQPTLHPPHSHHSSISTSGGGESSSVVASVIAAADEIATRPYVYGGGHGSFQSTGYDCSGSVSYALHGGGLLSSPQDSSELESYGEAGPGRHITIYANAEHAFMVIDGRRFDTISQQETGTRWSSAMSSTAGYVARHPAGL